MKNDMKLINRKLRESRKLPETNPTEYNHKQDILRHWEFERHMLKQAYEQEMYGYGVKADEND